MADGNGNLMYCVSNKRNLASAVAKVAIVSPLWKAWVVLRPLSGSKADSSCVCGKRWTRMKEVEVQWRSACIGGALNQASWVAGSDWYVRCHKSKACAGIGFTLTHVILGRSPPYSVTILRKWNNKCVSAIPACLVGV